MRLNERKNIIASFNLESDNNLISSKFEIGDKFLKNLQELQPKL